MKKLSMQHRLNMSASQMGKVRNLAWHDAALGQSRNRLRGLGDNEKRED